MKNEKPILFSAPMVRAILDGKKTQTRRIVKNQSIENIVSIQKNNTNSPYGRVGDFLWVRETWRTDRAWDDTKPSEIPRELTRNYKATPNRIELGGKWRPAIFMPRWASRITLRVEDVRIERLRSITEQDAQAEGVKSLLEFYELWDKLNFKRGFGWQENPFVWVLSFSVESVI